MSTTTTEERPRNVIDAIAAVMAAMPGIGKGERSEQGYNYRGIEAITKEAQPLFGRYTVVFVPRIVSRAVKEFTINNKPWTEDHLEVVYTVYGPGGLDDHIEIGPLHGLGRDNSDKGVNKALTQAYKYALIQTLCIGDAKDDADREPAREADAKQHAEDEFPEHTPDELARQAGWMDLEHAETTRALSRRLLGERINAGEITREEGNAAWGDYGSAPSYAYYTAWAEKWLLAQTSAVEGGDHPSPPTTAEEVSTPPGSESAPQSRDEDGVEHVARDGASEPTVAATPSAPDLMEALEASLAAVKGAQEEEDPLVVGSERTPSSPVQSALGEGSEVTRLGDEIVAQMDGMEGPAVPEGSVSYEFARRQVAGHAAETNPSKTQPEAFELAALALKRFPVGPISREDLRSALRAVEPAQEGEEDPFGPTKSQLEERAKDLAETSRRRRPEPRQMGLVD